ncbi:MAG: RNA polymerase sporulation sigma factor SigH [Acidimicrobiales bacterium]
MPHQPSTTAQPEVSDDCLAAEARRGEVEALNTLLLRYRRFARMKARGYFLAGGDIDDVEQEGMIGLFKAIRDFRPDREASFRAFAELCITRQIITAIKTATRQKHRPLNQYVSLWGLRLLDDPTEHFLEELFEHNVPDPADEIVSSEGLADMQRSLADMLSGLEVDVLRLYVEGWTYQEISEELGRHVKSIDNALQRIKRKVEGHLAERDSAELPVAVA